MKIGVVRHFRIPHSQVRMVDGSGFDQWASWYDTIDVKAMDVPAAGPEWQLCYASDLPRAAFTAKTMFKGPVEVTPLLREVPFTSFFPRKLVLPLIVWQATSRLGWWLNHGSQLETRTQTKARITEFVAKLRMEHPDRNVLVVTHGFYMQWLQKELVLAGFRGKVPSRPIWGTIYPFES